MNEAGDWAEELASALRAHVGGAEDAGLHDAYELGRKALADGVTLLEVIATQHRLLAEVLSPSTTAEVDARLARATEFIIEALSPYEMAHRGYREANGQLLRWKQMFDQATWGIAISTGGRLDAMNVSFARLYGYSVEELTGREAGIVLPEELHARMVERTTSIERKETGSFESLHVRKDGSRFPVQVDSVGVRDEAGKLLYVATNVRDITERKQAEENLRRAVSAAEEANRELDAFSYSVAHDLRAPLRSIDGFSRALLDDCADRLDSDGKRYLKHVREAAHQMGELIDDLLNLSRVTRAELRREHVDLSELARSVFERLRETQPDRQVELIVEDGLMAQADPRLLDIVLTNLLGNAWKFTGKRVSARIELAVKAGEDTPVYLVRDNGAGFDSAYANKLFGVFQRLHTSQEFEGTGIGLATVQRIIRRHGGRIWAEAEVDRGATFYFTLEEAHP